MNIIIDPYIHCPFLYYTLDKCNYVCPFINETPRYYDRNSFKNKYEFEYTTDIDYEQEYNFCFIVFPMLDIDERHEPSRHKFTLPFLKDLTNKIKAIKIIIFDNHDYCYMPKDNLLKQLKYDIILKRNYHKNIKYEEKIKPFHFLDCCGTIDPIYLIVNRKKYLNSNPNKKNKFWFSGGLYIHKDDIFNTYTDRKKIFRELTKLKIIEKPNNLPHSQYLNNIGNYKYAISLMGCSSWGTRHFEILTQQTILFSQTCDTIPNPINHYFPFEDNDNFSDFNFFHSKDDLKNKYTVLENNKEKYKEILDNQNYIVNKYYNYDYIKKYIFKFL